ncbi:hypothetical protein Pla52o_22500 [Novipirellula galeiformis]|uniref:Uncharacterized protein n=1 Tax=Novipirellula galeiformis TaxID=2528004 RepID=A0A5C6CHE6_9BACT|nr:hypothetical protein Pla52o_22500 [Novipirellula galeiformis]
MLFFVVHLAWMLYSLPYARDRDTRLELIGKIVPGFARLCIAGSVLIPSPVHSIALVVVAFPILVVGRACYELLVFRGNAR